MNIVVKKYYPKVVWKAKYIYLTTLGNYQPNFEWIWDKWALTSAALESFLHLLEVDFRMSFANTLASLSKTTGRKFKQILYLLRSKICECAVCICMETESTHISFETADKKKEHGSMLLWNTRRIPLNRKTMPYWTLNKRPPPGHISE